MNCNICEYIYDKSYIELNNTNIRLKICNFSDCKTKNVIYIIICIKCKCFYVGETENSLEKRLKQHLNHIKKFIPYLKYTDKEVAKHFRSTQHNLSHDFKVCIYKSNFINAKERKEQELDLINILNINEIRCINKFKAKKTNTFIFS